ncbi:hypothetical protein TRVA0_045S01134 [Trichomonascus vanleenenianus]|uniref:F-box protein n=1 Tax=Trichomonascus vanleenenianus TaxID=2268995 RepID=UPI003ECA1254
MLSLEDLPIDIFDKILSYFTGRELRYSRLVNQRFRHVIDDKIWKSMEISFEGENIIIRNDFAKFRNPLNATNYRYMYTGIVYPVSSVGTRNAYYGSATNGQCILVGFTKYEEALDYFADRYGSRIKAVTIDQTCSPNTGDYGKVILEKLRPKAININKLHLIASYPLLPDEWPVIQGAYYTLEIRGRTGELVSSMIDKVYHKECGKLDVIIADAVPVSSLPHTLFMSYGDTIRTLRLEINDADALVRLNNFLEFCVNLETLGLIVSEEIKPRQGSVVELPDSVRVLDFPISADTPGLTITARGLESFEIDFSTLSDAVKLNLTVNRLVLVHCSSACENQITKIQSIVFQDMLEMDTMDVKKLSRFITVIRRVKGSLCLWDDDPESFGKGPDYMSSYIEWFKAMRYIIYLILKALL